MATAKTQHDFDPEDENTHHHVGEHWSGTNPIPTIQKFIEHLDRDKRERDQKIDEENRIRREKAEHARELESNGLYLSEDQLREIPKDSKYHKVTDPTTGRDIEVEDMDKTSMERAKNPRVCWPLL